jgi:hypothetical protein
MSYKVLYYFGEDVSLPTKGETGRLSIEDGCVTIRGEGTISLPISSLKSSELFRMHNTGRMLKISFDDRTCFLSVIRFNVFGYFALVNFLATGRLNGELNALINARDGN